MSNELTLDAARARDAADPLARWRNEFHFPVSPRGGPAVYLCGNSLGLQPRAAGAEVAKFMAEWQNLGVLGYHDAEGGLAEPARGGSRRPSQCSQGRASPKSSR